jgi:histidine triad (HIT) family protein
MLPKKQIPQIKQQLIAQLENTNLPNKEEIKKNIEAMNENQLEEFLIQNKLIKNPEEDISQNKTDDAQDQQCIFCSIVSGKAQSYKIDENKNSIAVLEINPISKAHALIIPKEHLSSAEKIPKNAFSLAKKIAKKIKTKFKPKNVIISSSNLFGHEIINVLPVYKNETLNSQRHREKPEELEKIQKVLEKKKRAKIIKKPETEKIEKEIWLPKRIP